MKKMLFAGVMILSFLGNILSAFSEILQNTNQNSGRGNWKNIALGKPYTMEPEPNYNLCTDEDDRIQLTDGKSFGSNWGVKTTVGWQNVRTGQVLITIDIGSVEPIRGVSYTASAGAAEVGWPSAIFVLVSDDGKEYHSLGDLTALSTIYGVPPETGYAEHRYWTDRLKVHGRYIQFLVKPAGQYAFVDEIEVHRGEDAWVNLPIPGPAITDPEKYFADTSVITQAGIQRRLFIDLRRSREEIEKSGANNTLKSRLLRDLVSVEEMIYLLPPVDDPGKFQAVFPLNDLHARIFAVHGAIMKSAGAAPLSVWTANRFDFLTPTQHPPSEPERRLFIAAMKGETRSGTFNLTNATEKPVTVTVQLQGLPGGLNPQDITVHKVEWTETKESVPIAAALLQVNREGKGYPIVVPAGMTQQVWLNFTPRNIPSGEHNGKVVIKRPGGVALEISLPLRIFNETFPEIPTLHVGGWDYTDHDWQYGLTPKNVEPLIAHLRKRYVDTPWATSLTFSYGTFGPDGNMIELPDASHFDRWVNRWPGARRYAVFANVGDNIAGLNRGTPSFNRAVGEWITFWVNYANSKGIKPEQILLLLVDEPGNHEMDQRTIDWAKPIKAVQPRLVIWTDPTWGPYDSNPQCKPQDALPELWNFVDIITPYRGHLLRGGEAFADFYRKQLKDGHPLELYSCSGPASHLDPYSYYRLQAWTCLDIGAIGTNFWAFGCSGTASDEGKEGGSWNQYVNKGRCDTPLFLGPDSATPGKHMEAIRESVQDYEYMVMLRDRISQVEKINPGHTALTKARNLLTSACGRVLNADGAKEMDWINKKDRSVADQVCIEIGEMLGEINKR